MGLFSKKAAPVPAPPQTLSDLVEKLLYVRLLTRGGTIAALAFGGAKLDAEDHATLSVVVRKADGRAGALSETFDVATDPLACARAMVARIEAGEGGADTVPVLLSLQDLRRPFGQPVDFARRRNSTDAMAVAIKSMPIRSRNDDDRTAVHAASKVANACADRLEAVSGAFLDTLDPAAVALLGSRRVRMRGLSGRGVWEAIDATFEPDAPLGRAIARAPGLARALVAGHLTDPVAFQRAMSGDRPWVETLAELVSGHVTLPHRLAQTLAEVSGAVAGIPDEDLPRSPVDMDPLVSWVGKLVLLPPDWRPRGDAEWRAYIACQPALDWAYERSSDPSDLSRMINRGTSWIDLCDRLVAAAGDIPVRKALLNIDDMTRAFGRQVVRPAIDLADDIGARSASEHRVKVAADAVLFSGRSVVRVLEASASWHGAGHAIDARVAALPTDLALDGSWRPGFPDASYDGHEVVVLTSPASLADEGRPGVNADGTEGLAHCVGGYAPQCQSGRSRILSIRRVSPDGSRRRLSTVELSWRTDGITLSAEVVQHLGRRNEEPVAEAREVWKRYASDIREGRLAPVERLDLIGTVGASTAITRAGYEYTRPGHWEAVRDLWRAYLPRPARALSPDVFASLALAPMGPGDESNPGPVWYPATFAGDGWPGPKEDEPLPVP